MAEKNPVDMLAQILVIAGGLNWGIVGVANLDVVRLIFSFMPALYQIIYILVGLSALYLLYGMFSKK